MIVVFNLNNGVYSGVVLILISALLHALWNGLLKKDDHRAAASLAIVIVAFVVTASSLLFSSQPWREMYTLQSLPLAVGAGVCEGLYFITLARALNSAPLGMAYAVMRGTAMVLAWLFSMWLFDEKLSPLRFVGVMLVICGFFMFIERLNKKIKLHHLYWSLICGGIIAFAHLGYGTATYKGIEPQPLFALSLFIGLITYAVLPLRRYYRNAWQKLRQRNNWRLLAAGALCAVSFLLLLKGLSSIKPGQAITLRNSSIVFTQLVALAMGEPWRPRYLCGVLLVALGVTLVSWPTH